MRVPPEALGVAGVSNPDAGAIALLLDHVIVVTVGPSFTNPPGKNGSSRMNHHTDQGTNSDHAKTACFGAARLKLGALFP